VSFVICGFWLQNPPPTSKNTLLTTTFLVLFHCKREMKKTTCFKHFRKHSLQIPMSIIYCKREHMVGLLQHSPSNFVSRMAKQIHMQIITTVRGGQFQHLCVEIEFPHQIFRSPHHLESITRCHVALFDKT
jgi:hypothetical protein